MGCSPNWGKEVSPGYRNLERHERGGGEFLASLGFFGLGSFVWPGLAWLDPVFIRWNMAFVLDFCFAYILEERICAFQVLYPLIIARLHFSSAFSHARWAPTSLALCESQTGKSTCRKSTRVLDPHLITQAELAQGRVMSFYFQREAVFSVYHLFAQTDIKEGENINGEDRTGSDSQRPGPYHVMMNAFARKTCIPRERTRLVLGRLNIPPQLLVIASPWSASLVVVSRMRPMAAGGNEMAR
ncbi:hypothetical protein F4824DRAFT_160445 [Ustulina deusta]|nr:hypothetical protein F4824DRAFT_160445 [Ustulina deusta]